MKTLICDCCGKPIIGRSYLHYESTVTNEKGTVDYKCRPFDLCHDCAVKLNKSLKWREKEIYKRKIK